jgi:hypothetical protein
VPQYIVATKSGKARWGPVGLHVCPKRAMLGPEVVLEVDLFPENARNCSTTGISSLTGPKEDVAEVADRAVHSVRPIVYDLS